MKRTYCKKRYTRHGNTTLNRMMKKIKDLYGSCHTRVILLGILIKSIKFISFSNM